MAQSRGLVGPRHRLPVVCTVTVGWWYWVVLTAHCAEVADRQAGGRQDLPVESRVLCIGCKVGKWCDSYRHLSSKYEGESSSIEARKTPKNAITAKHFLFFFTTSSHPHLFSDRLSFSSLGDPWILLLIFFIFFSPSDWTSALRTLSEASCF